jgi:aryl-alcohol dehydrogenase-like predicted oxidoreductase
MLGIALGARRGDVVIASKFGLHVGEEQTVCDGAAVTQAIDDTLAALGTDYLDLMQIHWPGNIGYIGEPTSWPEANEVVAALEGAVAAGKLKHYGCCNFGTEDLAAFAAAGGKPVSNQLPYNLLFRTIESGILPACIDKNMGVLTYSSLQQALLTGKFTDPVSCFRHTPSTCHAAYSRARTISRRLVDERTVGEFVFIQWNNIGCA